MRYLKALDIIEKNIYNKSLNLNITTSFFSDVFNTFLKAYFLQKKIKIKILNNEFNTLKQTLLTKQKKNHLNLIILTPWDFCDQLNFREGTQINHYFFKELKNEIIQFVHLIKKKQKDSKIIYCDFEFPQTLINENENSKLRNFIKFNALKISDFILKNNNFDIDRFVDIGFPIFTHKLPNFAQVVTKLFVNDKIKKTKKIKLEIIKKNKNFEKKSKKILATDFDGVLWKGLIADDGYKNINCKNDLLGFKHFLYQKLLLRLKKQGILLIGITRNNYSDAIQGFKNSDFTLKKKDFVKIFASYTKKSESIKLACKQLNMSISNVLFIDDNLLEITEVKKNLPLVKSIIFPKNNTQLIKFLNNITSNFQKNYLTKEDKSRVNNYQINKNIKIEYEKIGSEYNIDKFLKSLNMKLKIIKKKNNSKDLERPFQLINKTNQFNINGNRIGEQKFKKILKKKGSLFSAYYKDKTGEYGEVITLLADNNKNIVSFVMSCRVFQRKIELEFLRLLIKSGFKINEIYFKKTKKNEPFRIFYKNYLLKYIDPISKKFNNNEFIKQISFSKKIFKSQILS
jgi:FkbH-like protein